MLTRRWPLIAISWVFTASCGSSAGGSGPGSPTNADASVHTDGSARADGQSATGSHEICNNGLDDDGDGMVDNGCLCTAGATQRCFVGDPSRAGEPGCAWGSQTCPSSGEFNYWGPCTGSGACTNSDVSGGGSDAGAPMVEVLDSGVPTVPHPVAGAYPSLCTNNEVNDEPEIFVGTSPANGGHVSPTGQIKVWVNDECPPLISPGEVVDTTSGAITQPGDHTARADDGYLWEPALYIAPASAETGGTPHFPSRIVGTYANMYSSGGTTGGRRGGRCDNGTVVMGLEPVPQGQRTSEQYTAEYFWDVSSLGLGPGTYVGEFVIHDGDHDRGVGCITFTID